MAAAFFLLLLGPPARAIDGALEARDAIQDGNAGQDAYHQESRFTEARAEHHVPFGRSLRLRLDGRLRRESLDGRVDTTKTDFTRDTRQAGASLQLSASAIRFYIGGSTYEQDNSGTGISSRNLTRRQLGTSGSLRKGPLRVETNGTLTDSDRTDPAGSGFENREWTSSSRARLAIPKAGELGYRLSTLIEQDLTRDARTTQWTHGISWTSSTPFAGGRGMFNLKTNSSLFSQKREIKSRPEGTRLEVPITGGFLLDDTPELLDLPEGELTSVPELYDGNRQVPTQIDLGDEASTVHEFGGDYRNIQYDFGEAVDLVSAVLYVDRTLLNPALFRFRTFVSNDPEGRAWTEIATADFRAVYEEFSTGLQGWTVTLARPISARFFKLVDEKLGPTVPELLVTEMEVFTRVPEVTSTSRSNTSNHRIGASLGYDLTHSIHAGYDLSYHRRTLSGQSDAVEEAGHGLSASWNRGIWSLSGRYELRSLEGRKSGDFKVNNQFVTLRRGRSGDLRFDLSWLRTQDQGGGLNKTSNSFTLGSYWPAAPALQLGQRVSVGWLNDFALGTGSTSMMVSASATGQPIRSVVIDLQWNDRWVTQSAGTGFTRYNDTSATLGWRPVPLVSLQSQVRYQVRDEGEWISRSSATWSPLSRGRIRAQFFLSHFRDVRSNETQESGGIRLEMDMRRNLKLEGSAQAMTFRTAGQENTPLNTEIRGTWRF